MSNIDKQKLYCPFYSNIFIFMSIIDLRKYHCLFFLPNIPFYVQHRLTKILLFLFPQCFHFYVQHRSTKITLSLIFTKFSFSCPTQINRNHVVHYFPNILHHFHFYVQHRNETLFVMSETGYLCPIISIALMETGLNESFLNVRPKLAGTCPTI